MARTLSKFFRVVSPFVFNAQASVIMIGQIRIAGIGSFYTHADMSGGEALKHWASTRVFIRRGQGVDAPVSKFKEYFIDPDGKIKYATQKEKIGFDAVLKLEKTKSCQSATEGSDIHLPFLFKEGFVNEILDSENAPIKIDAKNEEEKIKIEQYLEEKNLLPKKDILEKKIEEYVDSKEIVEVKKEVVPVVKKKRGRPSKKKESNNE